MEMLKTVGQKVVVIGSAAGALVAGSASAALPAEATAAFTSLSGSVTDILAAIWPILAAVTVGFALIKLFKRGTSKAV
ncbi:hypothetical protein SCT_1186 [Sulfuricella sp. T08]|uniref:major coat protein n=1 Tax=Sulfuricella sp. T08 TaxID=1632857 RepID=UPI00061797B6|nr:major coat protein [Sulfuricella sp. T08]GAO35794.1 hypothetical protein SCT_1186 [Sulfuricella sp. T08]